MTQFSKKQEDWILAPYNYTFDVAEGSPRSGKTFANIARFALHKITSRDTNHLVTAYSQEQAYRLIIEGDGYGLIHIFDGHCAMRHDDNGDYLYIDLPSGEKKVYIKGGGKADSKKAITGLSLGSVYFCEIDLLHPDMVQECFRRTFAAKDRWHIADLNPPAPQHPIIKVFEQQNTRWEHWTIHDNPIITEDRKREIEAVCKKNPYLYRRDWLGERAIPEGVIYSMFDPSKHLVDAFPYGEVFPVEMFFSGDGGLTDATSIDCWIVGRTQDRRYRLYKVANWYYDGGNKAMSTQAREIAGNFVPYCREKYHMRETTWLIDPACKALRKELELLGIMSEGADNNAHDIKGSRKGIAVGIEYLQSAMQDDRFFVVDDKRFGAEHFLREVGMYCVDDHGNPIDAYNHDMDACRYGNNYFYKRYVI